MSFVCCTPGCEGEAKIGGQCVKCACEAAKAKRGGVEPEGKIPLSNPPQSPFRKGGGEEKEKEKEMGKTGNKPVIPNCQDCGHGRKKGERFYKGKCPDCRDLSRAPKKGMPPKVEGPLPAQTARGVFGPPPLVEQKNDAVNHPAHYNQGKIEVADFIEDQRLDFFAGNVVKYVVRAPHKANEMEDLKKARWYLDRLISKAEKNGRGGHPQCA